MTCLVPRIIDPFFVSYSTQVCGEPSPVVGALFWEGGTEQGAWASFVVGAGLFALNSLGVVELPYHCVVGLIPALIAHVAARLITRKNRALSAT